MELSFLTTGSTNVDHHSGKQYGNVSLRAVGCAKSKKVEAAACPQPEANGDSGRGSPSPAKDHLPGQPLPEDPATGVSGPSGPSSPSISDPRARLRAYIDSHPVVIFSKPVCKRCAEGRLQPPGAATYCCLEKVETSESAGNSWISPEEGVFGVRVKKLFKSMHVPYFLLELDQAGKILLNM
nr:thioredoxin reductase 1, cytoplasmic-like [Mirounga angustirostris]